MNENSYAVDFPNKTINGQKWCTALRDHVIKDDNANVMSGHVTQIITKDGAIKGLEIDQDGVKSCHKFDNVVMAAGMGSVSLCKEIGIKLPLLAFKGHSLDIYHKSVEDMMVCSHILIPEQIGIIRMSTGD
jgi:glycine/D-amino acid oxidase-like deaminating enzyme